MSLPSESISSTLVLPTRLDHLHPLLAYSRKLAEITGFSDKEQQELELAIEEIFSNIIEHGFENNHLETCQVSFEITATRLTIKFFEKGLPFDPATLPDYSPEQVSESSKGLGIYLTRKLVDDITFRYLGREGKETSLTKLLRKHPPLLQTSAAAETVHKSLSDINYQIRLFQPEDSIAVARCAYRSYGYSYADHVYDPAMLIEQNKSGSLLSLVAMAETDDEALGYGDLRLYGEIAEVESLFIKPEYRSTRLFHKMANALIEQCRRDDLFGSFCLSVTSHIITQKGARFMGMVDCGILLGFMPETDFKSMSVEGRHRVSVAMAFGILKDRAPVTVYPPASHRALIEKIYTALKVPFVIADCATSAPSIQSSSVYDLEIQSDMNIAVLRLSSCGPDAAAIIREQTSRCFRQGLEAVYLYLDLQDRSILSLTAEAEKIGFFFAGVLPSGLDGKDTLILQYLNSSTAWDEINLATPFAKELLAYIRQDSERIAR